MMDDKSCFQVVDTHTKGDGSHDDLYFLCSPFLVNVVFVFLYKLSYYKTSLCTCERKIYIIHVSMVRSAFDPSVTLLINHLSHCLCILFAKTVNDTRLIWMMGSYPVSDVSDRFVRCIRLLYNTINKVWSYKNSLVFFFVSIIPMFILKSGALNTSVPFGTWGCFILSIRMTSFMTDQGQVAVSAMMRVLGNTV